MVEKTLSELAHDKQSLAELLDDPDIDDQAIFDTLEGVDYALEKKLNNCMGLINGWLHSEAACVSEVARLQVRRRTLERRVKRLKSYIAFNLGRLNEPKIETDFNSFSMQAGRKTVEITDAELLPDEYVKMTKTPDKTKIKSALQKGEPVPGAELVTNDSYLVIR